MDRLHVYLFMASIAACCVLMMMAGTVPYWAPLLDRRKERKRTAKRLASLSTGSPVAVPSAEVWL